MANFQDYKFFERLWNLFTSPAFLAIMCSWLAAQFIKTFINICTKKIHSAGDFFESLLWRTGGMPSSHTAVVVSVATTIGFDSGIDSDLFILACCLMFITIRDAVGVRRSSGIQAMKINEIGHYLSGKDNVDIKSIKEVQGHKPLEVFFGAVVGLVIGVVFSVAY